MRVFFAWQCPSVKCQCFLCVALFGCLLIVISITLGPWSPRTGGGNGGRTNKYCYYCSSRASSTTPLVHCLWSWWARSRGPALVEYKVCVRANSDRCAECHCVTNDFVQLAPCKWTQLHTSHNLRLRLCSLHHHSNSVCAPIRIIKSNKWDCFCLFPLSSQKQQLIVFLFFTINLVDKFFCFVF